MTGLFRVLSDVPADAAAAATVLIRLATLWYAVALGSLFLALERRREAARRLRAGPEPAGDRAAR
jgi:uncharacterized membrane protein YbhN (UPF0104 family)